MFSFDLFAVLITVAALFAYVNFRYLKLPSAIGIMLLGLGFSLGIFLLEN